MFIDRSDVYHESAKRQWGELVENDSCLVTSNYIVSETAGLLQFKIGFDAAKCWYRDVLEILETKWVDPTIHQRAYELWLNLGLQNLRLEECVTFAFMHHHQIDNIFCFKSIFAAYGFCAIPEIC